MLIRRLMRRKRYFNFVLLSAILAFIIVSLLNKPNNEQTQDEENRVNYIDSFNYEQHKPLCNPYDNKSSQFYVTIDGVRYPQFVPLYNNKTINFSCLNSHSKRNRILLWNKYWSTTNYYYGLGKSTPFEANNCPVTNCELTNNRSLLNESDFVVIHMLESIDEYPKFKSKHQKWIFYENESPLQSINFHKFNNIFDVSSTYRSDSITTSIYYAESSFYWVKNNELEDKQTDYSYGKDRFAAVVISNCNDKSNRLEYIKEMQKHVKIDIYGKCGLVCPVVDCQYFISNKYKFYISFENSFCKDYITEKFFGILKYNIIPVVLGGGPYERYVPKSGYINAIDYGTPEKLSEYLSYLSTNKTAYNSYFKWKKYVKFDSFNPFLGHICEWCILLNLDVYQKIQNHPFINNMDRFWNPSIDCKWPDKNKNKEFIFQRMSEQEGRKYQKDRI